MLPDTEESAAVTETSTTAVADEDGAVAQEATEAVGEEESEE